MSLLSTKTHSLKEETKNHKLTIIAKEESRSQGLSKKGTLELQYKLLAL